jgi:antitoxin component YwqK of YwqJK toxin-antitoxin module
MLTLRSCVVGVVAVLLVSGVAGACSGGLERVDGPCPSGQELREERHDATSIKSQGCAGTDSEGNYRRQGHWEFFHPNGEQRGEGSYVDGILVGGETDFTGLPSDGREGLWVVWYTNGQRRFEGRYRDGELEGFSTEWFANGQKRQERSYRDGEVEGLTTQWHENGQKWSEATYLNGTRTSRTEWDESGNQTRAD